MDIFIVCLSTIIIVDDVMDTLKKNGLIIIIALLSVAFILSGISGETRMSEQFRVFILPLIFLSYVFIYQKKNLFFSIFLGLFMIGELIVFFRRLPSIVSVASYVGNTIYILAYLNLIVFILLKMNTKLLFKRFPFHTLVLLLFGAYLIYALDDMVQHHGKESMPLSEYIYSYVYNVSIVLVLVFSLLSYLYHDTRSALVLFIVCSCIVFAELVQVAYYFITREDFISTVYSFLLSGGFCLLYVFVAYCDDLSVKSMNEKRDILI